MMMRTHTMGEGRPLVLVGGGLTGWLSWTPHQERLAATRRVARAQPLVVQFGLDDQPVPADYSVELESAALAAAVDAFHPGEPVDLVAWSYGGFVTLEYALSHAERIRTLTLIEPPAFWIVEAAGDPAYEHGREQLRPLAERVRHDVTEADLEAFVQFASLCPPGVRPQDLPQWPVWFEHRRSLRGQFDAVLGYRGDLDRVRAFDRPVLLVKGAGSTPVLHAIIDILDRTLPNARRLELSGGHAPQLAEIDRFLEEMTRFQESVRAPAETAAFRAFESEGWSRIPSAYDESWTPVTAKAVDPLLDAARVTQGTRVLDVATGPGHAAARASARGADVVAIDLADAMVARAACAHPKVAFRVADAEALPFGDRGFDSVISSFGLGHFSDPERAVAEMARVLAPGGHVALAWWDAPERARILGAFDEALKRVGAAPPADVPRGPAFFHYSCESRLIALLRAAGFEQPRVERVCFVHLVGGGTEALWNQVIYGTVRMSAAIRGQNPTVQQRIRASVDTLLAPHAADDGLRIPVSILIASGRKP